MADAKRLAHAVVVLLAVGAYSFMLFRGLNTQLSKHMFSYLREEVDKNPHMKKDLEDYKKELEEQERQAEEMKVLEEQAKRIQDQLQQMAKKQSSFKPLKYVKIEDVHQVRIDDQMQDPPSPNHSKQEQEQQKRKRTEL